MPGAALVAAFLAVESRVRDPLLPLSIMRHLGRGGAYLVFLLIMIGPFGAYLFISFFLQSVQGYSALNTGLAFLPLSGGVILASAIASQLMIRIPPRFVMGPACYWAPRAWRYSPGWTSTAHTQRIYFPPSS